MADLVTVLHLTDLHLQAPPTFDQDVVLGALLKDLKAQYQSGVRYNLAIFSGDLANAALGDEYQGALDLLLKILDASGLNENSLIMVPGNHDAARNVVGASLPQLDEWRKQAAFRDGGNALSGDRDFRKYVASTFENFSDLRAGCGSNLLIYDDPFCSTYRIGSTCVVTLNTATLTAAGLVTGKDDRGYLFVPERSLVEALNAATGTTALVAGHHPFEWLNDTHGPLLQRILSNRAASYFCGHLHEVSPRATRNLNGSLFVAQSGALYRNREYWNGYATAQIDIDAIQLKVSFRRWFEPRREFSHAEDLANGGIFFSSDQAEAAWLERSKRVNKLALDRWRSEILVPALVSECNEGLSYQSLEEIFVCPEFERDVLFRKETDERVGSRPEVVSFNELLNGQENYLITAAKESGKSTLLKQMALSIARQECDVQRGSIPVFLNFASFKAYKLRIETLVRQKLPQLPSNVTAEKLLESGFVTILIDDVEFRSAEKKKAMTEFIRSYPKCRYVLATSTVFVESAALQPEITPEVPFIYVRMKPLRARHILALIVNHGTSDPLKADKLLERVTRDASALNMPLTAVTSTFLIQIMISEPDEAPIHQAALVERYLEMLLQKFAPRELLPGTFNFRNKVDLLSVVAERMVREDEYAPAPNVFLEWVIQYLRGYGLRYSAADIQRYFLDSRILESDGEAIRFRLRVFFEFFVATRMKEDEAFREFIFGRDNYLQFPNEISFYAALSLRDRDRLNAIFEEFQRLGMEIWGGDDNANRLARYLENFKEPNAETSESELIQLQRQVRSPDQMKADREALLEGGEELPPGGPQEISRPEYQDRESKWIAHLVLLSGMLKHMELIPNWEKQRILDGVIDGWLQFTAISMSLIATLATEKKVVLNGVTYRTMLPDDLPVGELARRLSLYMPIGAARMAATYVGTEKLQLQLENNLGDPGEPVSRQFLKFSILAELMVDNILSSARSVVGSVSDKRFLKHVLARKLYDMALRYRLPDRQVAQLRDLVGDLMLSVAGVPAKEGQTKRSKVIESLQRQRLLIQLRRVDE